MSMELRREARERERETQRRRQERDCFVQDVRRIAATPEGSRVFRWLLREGDIFAGDVPAGFSGAFRAGRRSYALRIWHTLRDCLDDSVFAEIALAVTRGDHRQAGTSTGHVNTTADEVQP